MFRVDRPTPRRILDFQTEAARRETSLVCSLKSLVWFVHRDGGAKEMMRGKQFSTNEKLQFYGFSPSSPAFPGECRLLLYDLASAGFYCMIWPPHLIAVFCPNSYLLRAEFAEHFPSRVSRPDFPCVPHH